MENILIKFYKVKSNRIPCVSLEINGVDHCTSDIRQTMEGDDSIEIVVSKATLSDSKNSLKQGMEDSLEIGHIEMEVIECEIEHKEIKSYGLSYITVKNDKIKNFKFKGIYE